MPNQNCNYSNQLIFWSHDSSMPWPWSSTLFSRLKLGKWVAIVVYAYPFWDSILTISLSSSLSSLEKIVMLIFFGHLPIQFRSSKHLSNYPNALWYFEISKTIKIFWNLKIIIQKPALSLIVLLTRTLGEPHHKS